MRGPASIKALVASAALALLLAAPAAADTLHVTSGADSGTNSLRKAIADAKASGDVIVINASVPQIALKTKILIEKSLTIEGQGASATEITAENTKKTQFFRVANGFPITVKIARLKLAGGRAPNGGPGTNQAGTGGKGTPGTGGGAIENVAGGTLELSEVLLTDNASGTGGEGGDSTNGGIPGSGDKGGDGGAIYSEATLTISNSTIAGNVASPGGEPGSSSSTSATGNNGDAGRGGAIYNTSAGKLTIVNSTISGNEAAPGNDGASAVISADEGSRGGDGGAIFNEGTLSVTASTLADNQAGEGGEGGSGSIAGDNGGDGGSGGAVFSVKGPVRFTNTTFSENVAGAGGDGGNGSSPFSGGDGGDGGSGGAISGNASSVVVVAATTLAGNAAGAAGDTGESAGTVGGGGAFGGNPTLTVRGSLLASNSGGNTCAALAMTDGGGNLVFPERANCPTGFTVADPKLSAAGLAANGGPTQTIALEEGSAATNLVPGGECFDATGTPLSVDQRGEPRPIGSSCDAGAYEGVPARVVVPVVPANKPDAAPPIAKLTKQPKKTVKTKKKKTSIAFSFTADVAGATFECKLDKAKFTPCSSPATFRVRLGTHTFEVRALNSAGPGPAVRATVKVKKIKTRRKR